MTGKTAPCSSSSIAKETNCAFATPRPRRAAETSPRIRSACKDSARGGCLERFAQNCLFGFGRFAGRLGFVLVAAKVGDQAIGTARLARDANIAAVQNQPVMRMKLVLFGDDLFQTVLDFARILARRDFRAVGDAKNMRVHRDRRL